MASRTAHVPRTGATKARVGRDGSGSAKRPTRRQRDGRAKLRRQADEVFARAQEHVERRSGTGWALRWLEAGRPGQVLGPVAVVPIDAAGKAKLLGEQADQVADVIAAVLDGLGISDELWERGRDLAVATLTAASAPGWSPT
jgi:hypothetical protein